MVGPHGERSLEADPKGGLEDLVGVGGRHRDDPVGEGDGARHRVEVPVPLVGLPMVGEASEPRPRRSPLVQQVVDGEHRGGRVGEEPEDGAGVPVVEMEDVRPDPVGEGGHGGRPAEKPLRVVGPPVAVLVEVGVVSTHARDLDEGDRRPVRQPSGAGSGGSRPRRHRQVLDDFTGERPPLVVGEGGRHLDPVVEERGPEAGDGVGQAADLHEGRELGGGDEDVEGHDWASTRTV